jgi:hypothetical protein
MNIEQALDYSHCSHLQEVDRLALDTLAAEVRRLRGMVGDTLQKIGSLPNDGVRVVLIKRTGQDTVMSSMGYRDVAGNIRGWYGKRDPTHWARAPVASERFS